MKPSAALLAVLIGFGPSAIGAEEPSMEQCLDPAVCSAPYVRLTKQESEPFLFLGKVVDEDHPRHEDYERALRRFPDVRSCLAEEERNEPQPDLREIDWDAMRNIRDVDVCVFRIASSVKDVDHIKSWLRHQGFTVGEMSRTVSEKFVPQYETQPIYVLGSNMPVDRFREIFPKSWIAELLGFELLRNYFLGIAFSKYYEVVGVASVGNSKFN